MKKYVVVIVLTRRSETVKGSYITMKWPMAIFLLLNFDTGSGINSSLLPGKSVINIIPELFGYSTPPLVTLGFTPKATTPAVSGGEVKMTSEERQTESAEVVTMPYNTLPGLVDPPPPVRPMQHAGLPGGLAVYPVPLQDSYHELKFNISWKSSMGYPAQDYSIEVRSVTDTIDCKSPMCYEYNIPGSARSWEVPSNPHPVAETCAVRPGCAYSVRLIAHPWDGHTSANLLVELDECVVGVCSCAHSPRLPAPVVSAHTVSIQGEIFVNVSWITPSPEYPQRLPPELKKRGYGVSIGKQMVSDAHPSPWFAYTVTRYVDADGPVANPDRGRWMLLPVNERTASERGTERAKSRKHIVLDVRLLARVSVIDDRGCVGPAGNTTAYDPLEASKTSLKAYRQSLKEINTGLETVKHFHNASQKFYTNETWTHSPGLIGAILNWKRMATILWAVFGGACVITMGVLIAVSARVVKRILNAFRPAPVSAPLDPLSRRPAWFPLQMRT